MQRDGAGIRYLALTCAADCSAANAIYQDVPITTKITSGRYTLGARVRAEGHPGALRVAVTMLDRNGKVLGEKSFTESAPLPWRPRREFDCSFRQFCAHFFSHNHRSQGERASLQHESDHQRDIRHCAIRGL